MKNNNKDSLFTFFEKDISIIENNNNLKFSIDPLILSNFVTILPTFKNILDLGCGNCIIPILLSQKTNSHITGIEIQKSSYELAKTNIARNDLSEQISVINDDMKNWKKYFTKGSFDLIVTNPPFFKCNDNKDQNMFNQSDELTIAKHEVMINLDDIIKISSDLLKKNGYFSMVHRAERFIEIIDTMRKYLLEPKRIRFCYTKRNKDAKLVLIEGVKEGRSSVKMIYPLVVHNEDGSYTDEIKQMFGTEDNNLSNK